MKTVVITKNVDAAELAELRRARDAPMTELDMGDGVFDLEDGPFDHYRRTVVVDTETQDGRFEVTETVEYNLAIPVWGFLFGGVVRQAIKKPPPPGKKVWWLPPDRMDQRATDALSRLCVFSMIAAFLGVLMGQLNTYFQEEFNASPEDISNVGMAVRVAGFLALGVVAFADRRGRKTMLMISTYSAIGLAVLGAFAPSLVFLGTSQTFARTFSAAIGLLVGIMAAEEMPAGARAFAVSMLVASGAVGAGGVVVFLQFADWWSWRVFFAVPLVFLIPAFRVGRKLPESRRYEVYELQQEGRLADGSSLPAKAPRRPISGVAMVLATTSSTAPSTMSEPVSAAGLDADADSSGDGDDDDDDTIEGLSRSHWWRFAILASSAMLLNTFVTPAGWNFNEFLRKEHGFQGAQISLLQVITNLPGGISMLVGGRLAESRGRKVIGAIGTAGGVGFTVLMYLSSGGGLWLFSTLATLIGAIAIPALGVYSAELFPTRFRGLAGGGLNLCAVFGSVLGLFLAGRWWSHYGSFGPPMALLGVGPLIVLFIIVFLYPETAHRELEEMNPEDLAPPEGHVQLEELDEVFEEVHPHHHHHQGPAEPGSPGSPGNMSPRA